MTDGLPKQSRCAASCTTSARLIFIQWQRNVKNEETGKWEKKPYYAVEDQFPYGHGEKSVYLIRKHMKLTDEEAMAIRWHMGGFDDGSKSCGAAFAQYPLALHLHIADMQATYSDEAVIPQ